MMTPQSDADQGLVALVERWRAAHCAFATVTPDTHARVAARPGNARARSLRDVFGWSRPFDAGAMPADILALMPRAGILAEGADGLTDETPHPA